MTDEAEPAVPPVVADPGEEILRLASADNFRDVVGPGHTAVDGTALRAGVLYRANELQLLDEDVDLLAGLGIAEVFDLRDGYEVEAHPDVVVPGATWRHLPVHGIPPGGGTDLVDAEATRARMLGIYRSFVVDDDARASFATLLRSLATSSAPQLFHCTAGKDRTGWAAALVLHVAGVDTATIEADYLLTNERSEGTRTKYLGLIAEHLGADRVAAFEPMMVADVDYLHAAHAEADARYGGLDGYLRDGLGLTTDELAALRARLLEQQPG